MSRAISKQVLSLFAAVALCAASTGVFAQATRTWVSGVGDDANPCSRTAPCKTFAGAISKTATGGIINVLDPGGFGAVTITKAITIDGGGRSHGGILAAGTSGVIVNAPSTAVVIVRNLSIDGVGTGLDGIRFLAGGSLHVENVEIQGFTDRAIEFTPSATSRLFINNSYVHDNGSATSGTGGILIAPSGTGLANATITNTQSNENGFGVRANGRSVVALRNVVLSGNTNFGLAAVGSADFSTISIDECQASNNGHGPSVGAGIFADGALAEIQVSNCMVSSNDNGLRTINSGAIRSFGNNRVFDNTSNGAPTSTINEV
jgi:hypothetical protein